ncbi:hypothetical protein ACJX0J_010576, partial [Zea mays]
MKLFFFFFLLAGRISRYDGANERVGLDRNVCKDEESTHRAVLHIALLLADELDYQRERETSFALALEQHLMMEVHAPIKIMRGTESLHSTFPNPSALITPLAAHSKGPAKREKNVHITISTNLAEDKICVYGTLKTKLQKKMKNQGPTGILSLFSTTQIASKFK